MALFRKEEPERFSRKSSTTSSWIEVTRAGIDDASALVPANQKENVLAGDDDRVAAKCVPEGVRSTGGDSRSPIRALVGGVELAIPPGSDLVDIVAAFKAASSL